MTISEVIEKLQELEEEYGDCPLMVLEQIAEIASTKSVGVCSGQVYIDT